MGDSLKWGLWLAGTLGSFAAMEYKAIKGRQERIAKKERSGTLTSSMRHWLGIDPPAKRRFILAPLFGAFCTYLFTHFLFGWWMF